MHTQTQTYRPRHTHRHTQSHTDIHTHIDTDIYSFTHRHTHSHTGTLTDIHTHTIHTNKHVIHSHTHTQTQTYMHTYTHTHTDTHTGTLTDILTHTRSTGLFPGSSRTGWNSSSFCSALMAESCRHCPGHSGTRSQWPQERGLFCVTARKPLLTLSAHTFVLVFVSLAARKKVSAGVGLASSGCRRGGVVPNTDGSRCRHPLGGSRGGFGGQSLLPRFSLAGAKTTMQGPWTQLKPCSGKPCLPSSLHPLFLSVSPSLPPSPQPSTITCPEVPRIRDGPLVRCCPSAVRPLAAGPQVPDGSPLPWGWSCSS